MYLEGFRQLVQEHPECWHLCCKAEDRCRAEHMPRVRRARMRSGQSSSWPAIFMEAIQDDK